MIKNKGIKLFSLSILCLAVLGCGTIIDKDINMIDNNSLIYSGPTKPTTNIEIFRKTGESINN